MNFQSQDVFTRLAQAFQLCDSNNIKQGESQLAQLSVDRHYPIYLLQYLANYDKNSIRAASEFKRWSTTEWTKPSLQDIEFSEVHIEIKNIIVGLWISMENKAQEGLLRESILAIAKWEFPFRWENLTTNLMSCLNGDLNQIMHINNYRVFKLLSKLTAKYEYSSRSDDLYREIIMVADTTADYLLHFASNLVQILTQNTTNDANIIKGLLIILKQVIKCFYFLNCQDMPEKIENNLKQWMEILSQALSLNFEHLGEDVTMQVFKCKGESLRSILLYFTKYKEDVEPLVQSFSQQIYVVCTSTTENESSNKFMLNALKYFKNLLYWSDLREFFAQNMGDLLQNLIFRMEKPTSDDVDVFEESEAFIENVFNNAGGSTRKNTVHELAKALSKSYTEQVIPFLKAELENHIMLVNKGESDPVNEIKIINVLIDMGVSKFTPKTGVTEAILPFEFFTFFYSSVVEPTLKKLFEVVKSDPNFNIDSLNLFHLSHLIRYVFFFRNYFDKGQLLETIQNISFLIRTKNETFKRALYHSIEGLIGIRDSMDIYAPTNLFYNKNNAYPQIQFILQNIYEDIKNSKELTPYVLRALFTVIKIMDDSSAQFVDAYCALFKDMIVKLTKSYDFNTIFLVFDSLASFIAFTKDNAQVIEFIYKEVFPLIDQIIKESKSDMLSYAFQIYALAIHFHNLPSDNVKVLFDSLMSIKNWVKDNIEMFPAYLMFIEELIVKQPDFLWNNLESIQNILYVILIDHQQDQLFFNFINRMTLILDLKPLRESGFLNIVLQIELKAILDAQNQATQENKVSVRATLGKNILVFWSLCIVKFTFEEFLLDVQKAFGNDFFVFYNFLIQEMNIIKQYQKQPERKVMMNGMESIIFSSIYEQLPPELWKGLLNGVVENICRRKKSKLYSDLGEGLSTKVTTGFSSNFQKLSWFATQKLPYSELPDEDTRFLSEFQGKFSNMASQILQQYIDEKLQKPFQELFN